MVTVPKTAAIKLKSNDAATLVALTLKRVTNKAGEPRNRIRMTDKTFKRLTGRAGGGAGFLRQFSEELRNLGWLFVRMPSAYGFVRLNSFDGWPQIRSNVVANELKLISVGSVSEALDRAREELGAAVVHNGFDEGNPVPEGIGETEPGSQGKKVARKGN